MQHEERPLIHTLLQEGQVKRHLEKRMSGRYGPVGVESAPVTVGGSERGCNRSYCCSVLHRAIHSRQHFTQPYRTTVILPWLRSGAAQTNVATKSYCVQSLTKPRNRAQLQTAVLPVHVEY